jgi:3'-phosphoadenosine 5'-phosphosulfate sulfotransferase (PAPS reductase)/FAD synthetase
MMPPNILLRFQLYSRLHQHKRRVEWARQRVSEWLEKVENPYVSFSTGKDSTCVLHLVREQAPDTPAVYWDADCAFPESKLVLSQTENIIVFKTDEPFLKTLKRFDFSDPKLENETMKTTVWGPIRRLQEQHDFDGMAYGLRMEESRGRELLGRQRGSMFYHHRDKVWACQPIYDWLYDDVWAFIVTNRLAYCGTYDKMWDMPEREQRISYWAGETNRERGRWAWLKRNYPELFNRFAAEFPEARCYV